MLGWLSYGLDETNPTCDGRRSSPQVKNHLKTMCYTLNLDKWMMPHPGSRRHT